MLVCRKAWPWEVRFLDLQKEGWGIWIGHGVQEKRRPWRLYLFGSWSQINIIFVKKFYSELTMCVSIICDMLLLLVPRAMNKSLFYINTPYWFDWLNSCYILLIISLLTIEKTIEIPPKRAVNNSHTESHADTNKRISLYFWCESRPHFRSSFVKWDFPATLLPIWNQFHSLTPFPYDIERIWSKAVHEQLWATWTPWTPVGNLPNAQGMDVLGNRQSPEWKSLSMIFFQNMN